MPDLTYPEALVVGLLQGVSELFPVSSLGHGVLVPALLGGKWAQDMDMTAKSSPYLSVLVAMHVATALALVVFFWRDWVRIVGGLVTSLRDRRISTPDQRLGWLLVVGTIPVGIAGVLLDHLLREYLGKPIPVSIFLAINGIVLFAVEKLRGGHEPVETPDPARGRADTPLHLQETVVMSAVSLEETTVPIATVGGETDSDVRLSRLSWKEAFLIGASQSLALFPGISRSGITMVGGLLRGLRHDDAARFAFLLSTPAILGAGLLKLPELAKPEMRGVVGPALAGSVLAGLAAYVSVRFLVSYFETKTLRPFGIYCMIAGLACLAWFTLV